MQRQAVLSTKVHYIVVFLNPVRRVLIEVLSLIEHHLDLDCPFLYIFSCLVYISGSQYSLNCRRSISRAASQTGSSVSPMPGRPRRDTCRSESRSRVTSVTCQSDTNSRVSPLPSDAETQARDETEELREQLRFRVCLMGEAQVGKTSLVSQFLTSEYMNTYDASLGIVGSLGSFIIEY